MTIMQNNLMFANVQSARDLNRILIKIISQEEYSLEILVTEKSTT